MAVQRIDPPRERTSSRSKGTGSFESRLPGDHYWTEQQFQLDIDRVFSRNWLFVAHECQLPNPGDYLTVTIGRDSIILIRDKNDCINAFFNSCRHRGSLITDQPCGNFKKMVCPYHHWVYGQNGELEHCRLMECDIRKEDYSLHRAHVEVVYGLVFLSLALKPRSFERAREVFSRYLSPHHIEATKVCIEYDYLVKANWKTVFENNRECYHCAVEHQEFCLSNFDYGMPGDPRSSDEFLFASERMEYKWRDLGLEAGPVNFPDGEWFRCMRFPLKPGFVTESLDGKPVSTIIGGFDDHDIGSLRIVGLPNMWFHVNSDYVMTTRLLPMSPTETSVKVVWYVHEDAKEGIDYEPERVAEVWRITSEQDWRLCELNQLGLQSSRYVPGALSHIAEQGVAQFAHWYLNQVSPDRS